MCSVDGTCCRMMGNIWGVKVNAWTSCFNGADSNMRASEKYTIMIRVATCGNACALNLLLLGFFVVCVVPGPCRRVDVWM